MKHALLGDGKCRYPEFRDELVALAEEDQNELVANMHAISLTTDQVKKDKELKKLFTNCHVRASRMSEILEAIGTPSISKVGTDGCEAILLITQHSYLALMKKVLKLFEQAIEHDPLSVPIRNLPSLIDRIMVLEERRQLFGTQWKNTKDNKPFLVTVIDFENVNMRRAEYGLDPVHRPVNLAEGAKAYPLGRGLAIASDQKDVADEEYEKIAKYSLKSMA